MYKLVLLLLACVLVKVPYSSALSGDPEIHMNCEEPVFFASFKKIQCEVSNSAYVPPTATWSHPVAVIMPQDAGPHRIVLKMSGYNARPYDFCTDLNFSKPGFIVVKPCAGHYPDLNMHTVNGVQPMGWWGRFRGDSNSMRVGLALSLARSAESADIPAGVHLEGSSYGGTGAILQSMMLREVDPWWGDLIAVVNANVPHTLFVKNWKNDPAVNVAWEGYDRSGADVETQMANGNLKHTYYRVNGSPADNAVTFDIEFFELCQRYKIACFGTWHAGGHNSHEPGINLPFGALYAGPNMDVRLDQMLPVFTNSTANHWGAERGHYNLGLSWHQGDYFVDSADGVIVPLRYKARYNIGGEIPDQPNSATFDLTIRRIRNLPIEPGSWVRWQLGNQASGTVQVTEPGEVSISNLTLATSEEYTSLMLTPV
ncbi:MAG: hypothetical protein HKN19_09120, partial [Halioglobus sp.]|nr:hypothetical protein [Halioglobus sp.]